MRSGLGAVGAADRAVIIDQHRDAGQVVLGEHRVAAGDHFVLGLVGRAVDRQVDDVGIDLLQVIDSLLDQAALVSAAAHRAIGIEPLQHHDLAGVVGEFDLLALGVLEGEGGGSVAGLGGLLVLALLLVLCEGARGGGEGQAQAENRQILDACIHCSRLQLVECVWLEPFEPG